MSFVSVIPWNLQGGYVWKTMVEQVLGGQHVLHYLCCSYSIQHASELVLEDESRVGFMSLSICRGHTNSRDACTPQIYCTLEFIENSLLHETNALILYFHLHSLSIHVSWQYQCAMAFSEKSSRHGAWQGVP
jgi:hypothetical protein